MPRGPATCVSGTGEARPHLSLLADAITAGEAQERNGEPSLFFLHARHACGPGAQPRAFKKLLLSVTRLAARSRKEVFVSVLGLACARPSCCPNTSFSCVTRLAARSRKEVFQPHLPVRLPCYDLAPITGFTLGRSLRVTDFRRPRLSWLDGRCVQGPGTYSPRHG